MLMDSNAHASSTSGRTKGAVSQKDWKLISNVCPIATAVIGAGHELPQPPTVTVPKVAVFVCLGITCGLLSGSPYILQF